LIARRAYELFESSGFTDGHAHDDWLRAESEILLQAPVKSPRRKPDSPIRADVPAFSEKRIWRYELPTFLCIAGSGQESSDQKEGTTIIPNGTPTHLPSG